MVKGFVRCGICDKDFKSTEGWERHSKSREHLERVRRWKELCVEDIAKNSSPFLRDNAKRVQEEVKATERVEFT